MLQTIAIIEDDYVVRQNLSEQIKARIPLSEIRMFPTGEDAMLSLSKERVDVALFDIQLPGMSGIDCIRKLKLIHPDMQMMVLTVYENTDLIFDALKAGANSYILKSTPPEKIAEAIRELYEGASPISSVIARKVIESFRFDISVNEQFEKLSKREQEILEALHRGRRYKEIADQLHISIETVRTHIRNIYEKLQVNCRREALKKTGLG